MLASVGETWVKFRNMLPLGRAPVPGCSPISTTCGLEWTKHGHWVRFDQVWAEFVRNWTEFYRRRGSVGRTWPDAAVHRPISSRIPPPGRRSDGHLGTLIEQRPHFSTLLPVCYSASAGLPPCAAPQRRRAGLRPAAFWYSLTDFAQFPHLTHFESIPDSATSRGCFGPGDDRDLEVVCVSM